MIGNTVSVGKFFSDKPPVYPAVLAFPTLAAVNWYHNHPSNQNRGRVCVRSKEVR